MNRKTENCQNLVQEQTETHNLIIKIGNVLFPNSTGVNCTMSKQLLQQKSVKATRRKLFHKFAMMEQPRKCHQPVHIQSEKCYVWFDTPT
jgi:hypothetical protein